MTSKKGTTSFSGAELREMRVRGKSQSDFTRLDRMSEAELEKAIAEDDDFKGISTDWLKAAEAVMPSPKKLISLRLDSDVVSWFRDQGTGYQTRINAVLRAFVEQQDSKGGAKRR